MTQTLILKTSSSACLSPHIMVFVMFVTLGNRDLVATKEFDYVINESLVSRGDKYLKALPRSLNW